MVKERKKTLGKSEARAQFLPLVDAVSHGAGPVEITDYGNVVAVLISKHDYDWMTANTQKSKPMRSLCGLGVLLGDLEAGSKEIAEALKTSVDKSAKGL